MNPHLLRITTVSISLEILLQGQFAYMQANNFRVSVVSAEDRIRSWMPPAGVIHYKVPMVRRIAVFSDLWCLILLIRLMYRVRPDIVHTHTPKAGLLGMLAAKIVGIPIRIHTVGGLPLMVATRFRRLLLTTTERLTYWAAQYVWPNSEGLCIYIKQQGLCPVRKLELIANGSSNGIDLTVFTRKRVKEKVIHALKSRFNYDPKAIWLVTIGRLVKDKGITELLTAFGNLQSEYANLHLLLAGPVERERAEETLEPELLDQINTNPSIHYFQWVEDVAALLCLMDILVHPSHREGFPNVLLQAGAMEVPIVCSDIPGNIDIVTNQETGLTYPVKDTAGLTTTLRQVLAAPEQAQERATRLRQKIEAQFDRKIVHAALLARYQELLTREEI